MKKLLAVLVAVPALLVAVALARALTLRPDPPPMVEAVDISVDEQAVAERLARALTYPTVSPLPPAEPDSAAFRAFHAFLEEAFPRVHGTLVRETIGGLGLLYRWQGASEAAPVVLMGHQDVVPVLAGTESDWEHPPFGGVIADGWVWGRGALDDKATVLGILEAVEALLAEGWAPPRTLWLAFGHDEEIGGHNGARAIAELLASRGEAPALVLDEGGTVLPAFPGVDPPVALVGISEKGYLSLELTAEGLGGHSSSPPPQTAIGIVAAAVTRLEADPFPLALDGTGALLFERLAPHMGLGGRLLLGNRWLFGPVLAPLLGRSGEVSALLRTTTAATVFQSGEKDNVLPIEARAVVNFRIRPGETVESVTARVRDVIDDDRVRVRPLESARDPSPVSDPDSEAFALLARTIHEVIGTDVVVTPYVVPGGTDAWYYGARSANVFRFLPIRFEMEDLARMHGTGERIAVAEYAQAVRFFRRLIQNTEHLPWT